VIESPVAAATEIIHAEVPGGEMRSVEPVAHVAAAAPVEAEVRVEAAPVVVLAQIQAEVQAQVQHQPQAEVQAQVQHQPQAEVQAQVQHQPQAEAVVLAAPVITETPVVATPYTSVASEERVVEFTPPLQVVAPVAPQPLVLPDGLDQIETDTEKLHRAASKVADAAPPRPPRVRPALPVISNEPLMQVETGR
jgi:uncharacterized protein (DUF58 family)